MPTRAKRQAESDAGPPGKKQKHDGPLLVFQTDLSTISVEELDKKVCNISDPERKCVEGLSFGVGFETDWARIQYDLHIAQLSTAETYLAQRGQHKSVPSYSKCKLVVKFFDDLRQDFQQIDRTESHAPTASHTG